jgi:hypothetical protein
MCVCVCVPYTYALSRILTTRCNTRAFYTEESWEVSEFPTYDIYSYFDFCFIYWQLTGTQTSGRCLCMYAIPTACQVSTSNKRVVGTRLCTSENTECRSWQTASGYCGKARTVRNSTLLLTASSSSLSCFLLLSSTLKDLTLFSWCGRWWKPSSHFVLLPVRAILYFRTRIGNLEFTVKMKVYF